MTTSNGNSSNEFDNNTGEQINVVNYGSNAGTMVGKVEIDTPATFSATYTIDKQIDGKYFATVTVKSNKSTNLPNQICVIVKSDVQVTLKSPLSGDDGLIMGMSGHLGNSTCRLNPTSNMKAVFLLSDYPDTFEVYLSK